MGHRLKTAGIIRAGFEYQDLVAIETLLDYYRNPSRYLWVQVEATDPDFKAVDDVVACLADGRLEVTQVKFAADPDNEDTALDWDWLLDHKPKGKSLLHHWSDTVCPHAVSGALASARLKTNRKPDEAFAKCLKGDRVAYTKIPHDIRTRIIAQLGSATTAKFFFENFSFQHSQPYIDDLDEKLLASISTDTDPAGWAYFQKQVRLWSITKNEPKPDGRITHVNLRSAFLVESAKPIAQGFRIPADYQVPDEAFADEFADRVLNNDGVTVLWAPPGRGKSTFLSKFKAEIDTDRVVCIRHHYFLSLDDKSEARFFVAAIARSFEAQLDELIPDQQFRRQSIRDMIDTAARRIAASGKRLVVIIDGLDHVWREGQSQEDARQLFDALIPIAPGMHLVVGTQKIAEEHLPLKLLRAAPISGWSELKLMNRNAVRAWVSNKEKAGRLNLRRWPHESKTKALNAVADAFYDTSAGLPLHLIYSFEAVARSGEEVTPEMVAALPGCPSGDIRDYYETFLTRLSARGKVILHVMAGLDFSLPRFGISACLGNDGPTVAGLSEIDHLLDYREIEVRPFHGSLFAYLHERPEHLETFLDHSLPTQQWLENGAPDYWKQTWLWITEARRGNADSLITKPDRNWAIAYVAAGYPIDDLITVFEHAEQAALDRFDLTSLARLRLLKSRAINGPEFQTEDFPRLWATAARLSHDPYVPAIIRADLARLPAGLFPSLVAQSSGVQSTLARRAIDELNGRITRSRGASDSGVHRQRELAEAIVGVVGSARGDDAKRVLRFAKRSADADALLTAFAQSARLTDNYNSVFAVASAFAGRDFDREVFTALCLEGLAPSAKPTLKTKKNPAMRCLAIVKGDKIKGSSANRNLTSLFPTPEGPESHFQIDVRGIARRTFFSALAEALVGKDVRQWSSIPENAENSWLGGAIRAFETLAASIAEAWRDGGQWPSLDEVFLKFAAAPEFSRSHDAHSRFIAVRLALTDVAFDLALIGRAMDASYVIDGQSIERVQDCEFWLNELWLAELVSRRVALHDTPGFAAFFGAYKNELDGQVTEFNERTMAWTNLAFTALDHGCEAEATLAVHNAVDCLLGYGWRKDPFADEVLDALEMLIDAGDGEAMDTLLSLASAYQNITSYTDGSGTNHHKASYFKLIAKHSLGHVGPLVDALIDDEEWHYVEGVYSQVPALTLNGTSQGQELLRTFIMPTEHQALRDSSPTPAVLDDVERKVGRNRSNPRDRDRARSSTPTEPRDPPENPPEIQDYPPGRLQAFFAERNRLNIYESSRSVVKEWLAHWSEQKQGADALADLEGIIVETRHHSDVDSGLDLAAELAAQLHGRSEAFRWLVRAQIVRRGWQTYWTSSAEAEARLDTVARDYKARWKEFVRETLKPTIDIRDTRNGIVVPFTRLIYFLIALGELDLAKAHAAVMVAAFKAEVAQQPLPVPTWL